MLLSLVSAATFEWSDRFGDIEKIYRTRADYPLALKLRSAYKLQL